MTMILVKMKTTLEHKFITSSNVVFECSLMGYIAINSEHCDYNKIYSTNKNFDKRTKFCPTIFFECKLF